MDEENKDIESMSDHDILLVLNERTKTLVTWATNHDSQHFRYNLLAWTIALGAIVSLAIIIIKVL